MTPKKPYLVFENKKVSGSFPCSALVKQGRLEPDWGFYILWAGRAGLPSGQHSAGGSPAGSPATLSAPTSLIKGLVLFTS